MKQYYTREQLTVLLERLHTRYNSWADKKIINDVVDELEQS